MHRKAHLDRPAWRRQIRLAKKPGQLGLTFIELLVAFAVVALLVSGAVLGVGALTGTKAKASAAELAGVVRSLYDSAALSGKTCRLVFQLPTIRQDGPTKYWAECAASNVTTSRNRDELLRQERERRPERLSNQPQPGPGQPASAYQPSLQDLMAQERERVEASARYSVFTAPEVQPRQLPPSVKISVWTRHQREAVSTGTAYLYFFPQGFTEKAMIFVTQGSNAWTIAVQPLTGKAVVVADQLEVPRS
jgi:general secretion pathway protein H